jgi:cobalamin biosynthesis protein CobT
MAVDTWRWLQQYPGKDTTDIAEQVKIQVKVSKEAISTEMDSEGEEAGSPTSDKSETGKVTNPEKDEEEGETEDSGSELPQDEENEGEDEMTGGSGSDLPQEEQVDLPTPSDDQVADILQKNLWGGSEPGTLGDLSDYLDNRSKDCLSSKEAEEIQEYIETKQEDFTRQLNQMGIRTGVTKIKNAYYNAPSHNRVKAMVRKEVDQIHHIFSQLDIVEARWRHGLENGKLDGGRLSKVGVGKTTVFKHRDLRDRPSMAVELLLDVSGSMSGQLHLVNQTACIFAEGLKALYPKVWCEVITYNGGNGWRNDVELTRLASSSMKLSLQSVWHGGGTPSGEAIGAAMLLLNRRREQRKVILHFTDGAPDSSSAVEQALEHCRKSRVEVLTISLERKQTYLYGEGKVEVIKDVSELPKAVMGMMRKIYR